MDATGVSLLLIAAIAIFFIGKKYGEFSYNTKLVNSIGCGTNGTSILELNGQTDVHFREGTIVSIKNKEIASMQKKSTSSA